MGSQFLHGETRRLRKPHQNAEVVSRLLGNVRKTEAAGQMLNPEAAGVSPASPLRSLSHSEKLRRGRCVRGERETEIGRHQVRRKNSPAHEIRRTFHPV